MITTPKLTPAQLRVLRYLCEENRPAYLVGVGNYSAWHVAGYDENTRVKALLKAGMLEEKDRRAYATPAARAMLAGIDTEGKHGS